MKIPPSFNQCLEWLTEWMKEKHPELHKGATQLYMHSWGDDFTEYWLYDNEMTGPFMTCESVEMRNFLIFRFLIPATKEELFTLLTILDK